VRRLVFTLLSRRPVLLAALALPGGWVVELDGDTLVGCGAPE
jgi:hypothetical protein